MTSFVSFSQTDEEVKYGKIVLPVSIELIKISLWDSLVFNKVTTDFFKALESKDTKIIKSHSLKLIHCQLCDSKEHNLILPLDSFINQAYNDFDTFLFESIKKGNIRISEMLMRGFHPKYIPNNAENDLVVFEARVMTYEPSELNDGHDGLNYCFYFVKINNEFKFFLYNTIPKS
ncbi:MAG TPA: hypothetical protein VGC65_04405 [Bacteroidia bacterium]